MKSKVEKNVKRMEIKDKTFCTKFHSLLGICDLRRTKTIKGKNILNLKMKKKRYVKIDTLFSATKAMIPTDVNLFC